ncbi:hypothetical protein Y600_5918 [Burkholderia pseudomallei MSHR3709]|nr:hypothetical protein Y600_5918 [Burkholderia pseudomallei MSHR3709]
MQLLRQTVQPDQMTDRWQVAVAAVVIVVNTRSAYQLKLNHFNLPGSSLTTSTSQPQSTSLMPAVFPFMGVSIQAVQRLVKGSTRSTLKG